MKSERKSFLGGRENTHKDPKVRRSAQSYPTLCDPMDYTVHGILQAKIQDCVAVPFSREASQPRDCLLHCRQILYQLSHKGIKRCYLKKKKKRQAKKRRVCDRVGEKQETDQVQCVGHAKKKGVVFHDKATGKPGRDLDRRMVRSFYNDFCSSCREGIERGQEENWGPGRRLWQ